MQKLLGSASIIGGSVICTRCDGFDSVDVTGGGMSIVTSVISAAATITVVDNGQLSLRTSALSSVVLATAVAFNLAGSGSELELRDVTLSEIPAFGLLSGSIVANANGPPTVDPPHCLGTGLFAVRQPTICLTLNKVDAA